MGSFGGNLKDVSAVEMGTAVVKEALYRADVAPEHVDGVIFGNRLTASVLRHAARKPWQPGGQYLNELPPRNSRSSDVDGTWRLGMGLM